MCTSKFWFLLKEKVKVSICDPTQVNGADIVSGQGANLTVSRSKMLQILDISLHKFQLV